MAIVRGKRIGAVLGTCTPDPAFQVLLPTAAFQAPFRTYRRHFVRGKVAEVEVRVEMTYAWLILRRKYHYSLYSRSCQR